MHTGFTWLGCGAFIPRSKVLRFLAQLGSNGLSKDRLRVADMYFSIWTNQYPYQMSNPLTPLDQKEGWSDGVDQWRIVYQNIVSLILCVGLRKSVLVSLCGSIPEYDASSKLYEALAANAVDHFMREEEQPRPDQRDTR
ncbi:hypothetical protein BC936DRAFT_149067 [Jimgerdemannia flammicorona]|uniref:Uncharacterized protein n=1 Tax=Jimgerdemannia flammicorona TaxID=994334 RepID=A0A433D1L9_9FUNG|nr:hypothetical protein BC936DRAFT_149067 [Jimgerdemannia flammicorona]